MAKGKKTGGRDFPVGHKFGKGATCHNQELKKIRRMTHEEIADIGQLIVTSNLQKLKEIRESPDSNALSVWMSSIAVKGITTGDHSALDVILNRIVGKVKETVENIGNISVTNTSIYLENARAAMEFLKSKGEIEDGRNNDDDGSTIETTGKPVP